MKFRIILLITLIVILATYSAFTVACGDDDDDDDDDDDFISGPCDPSEQNPCEFNLGCSDEYDFGYETVKECKEDIIQPFLDSNNPCEQAAGECLNTIEKQGPSEDNATCEHLQPESCEEAWELWNECLALAEQEEC